MSDYLKRLASALKKREAPMGPNAWDWQTRADNAPVGSVNAPGGFMRPIPEDKPADNFGRFLGAAGMMPGPTGDLLGPLADAYMYATDPESRTPGNFAMSALGLLPFVPSMAGIFVGKNSKLWDALQAQRAQEMADAGVDARKIWQETGTWRGPDGAWRQEIDDSAAKLKEGGFSTDFVPRSKVMFHGPLSAAYPGSGLDVKVRATAGSGGTNYGRSAGGALIDIGAEAPPEKINSVLLHELQHDIQNIEGWAKGGSPSFYSDWAGDLPTNPEYAAALNKWNEYLTFKGFPTDKLFTPDDIPMNSPENLERWLLDQGAWVDDQNWRQTEAAVKDLVAKGIPEEQAWDMVPKTDSPEGVFTDLFGDKKPLVTSPDEAYRRLAGEAEARATEARRMLNPEQRRALFPADSYDVPLDSLIIRR